MSLCCREARPLLTDNSTQTIAVLQQLKNARKSTPYITWEKE